MMRKVHYIGQLKEAIRTNSYDSQEMQAKLQEILKMLGKRGLSGFEKLVGGHTGTPVYSCVTESGERNVAKLGIGSTKYEVDANRYGYRSLASLGLQDFIPNFDYLKFNNTDRKAAKSYAERGVRILSGIMEGSYSYKTKQ